MGHEGVDNLSVQVSDLEKMTMQPLVSTDSERRQLVFQLAESG